MLYSWTLRMKINIQTILTASQFSLLTKPARPYVLQVFECPVKYIQWFLVLHPGIFSNIAISLWGNWKPLKRSHNIVKYIEFTLHCICVSPDLSFSSVEKTLLFYTLQTSKEACSSSIPATDSVTLNSQIRTRSVRLSPTSQGYSNKMLFLQ